MSVKCMVRVWEKSKQKGGCLLLLLSIADHAGDDGFAWPGLTRLAARTRMTERHVLRMLAGIEADDELYIDRRGKTGHHNRYVVLVDLDGDQIEKVLTEKMGLSAFEANQVRQNVRGDKMSGVTPVSGGDDSGVRGGMTPTSPESLYNHHESSEGDGYILVNSLWSTILADLRGTMTSSTYEMHFSQTRAIERVNGCLVVSVPNDQSQDWLQRRWNARVLRAAQAADPTLEMVKFKTAGEG